MNQQQQPYNSQAMQMYPSGQYNPQSQTPQGHSPSMMNPAPQIPGQTLQQNPQGVPSHYGVQGHLMASGQSMGQGGQSMSHLQQRQGLNQLSNQMQGQYASSGQNGHANQAHPGAHLSPCKSSRAACTSNLAVLRIPLLHRQNVYPRASMSSCCSPRASLHCCVSNSGLLIFGKRHGLLYNASGLGCLCGSPQSRAGRHVKRHLKTALRRMHTQDITESCFNSNFVLRLLNGQACKGSPQEAGPPGCREGLLLDCSLA